VPDDLDLQAARRFFRDLRVLHLGTVGPDGGPHVVPLWFVWDDDAIYVSCRRGSVVERNVRRRPEVAVEMDRGRAWSELAGVLVRGRAEVLPDEHPVLKRVMSSWFEKYRGELTGAEFGSMAGDVREPLILRVSPEHLAGWAHGPVLG
jgi:PPOX class probable F420-dependent enzyme